VSVRRTTGAPGWTRPPLIDNESPSFPLTVVTTLGGRASTLIARYLGAIGWWPGMIAYGGYGSTGHVRILGRVLMTRSEDQREWLAQRRGWRQFFDAQVPRHPVLVSCGAAQAVAAADNWGFIDLSLSGHGLPAGWHTATLQPLHPGDVARSGVGRGDMLRRTAPSAGGGLVRAGRSVRVPVRVIGEDEVLGLVSDIDDTVVVSMAPRVLTALRHALVDRVSSREAVPGMASLLSTVARSAGTGHGTAPVVYLSTGAWNVATTVRDFLARLGFPRGALLMTSFGPSNTGWFRSGLEHKRRELRRLAEDLPAVRWVLVGDDGQRDPQVYAEFAREYPDHVAGIAIRSLSQLQQVMSHGSLTPLVPDALWSVPAQIPVWYGTDGDSLMASMQAGGLDRRLHPDASTPASSSTLSGGRALRGERAGQGRPGA